MRDERLVASLKEVVGTKRAVAAFVWVVVLVAAWAPPSAGSPPPYPSLFVVPAGGGTPLEIGFAAHSSFSWSPGGRMLVAGTETLSGIVVFDLDGSRALTEDRNDRDPAWSPAGDDIVFARAPHGQTSELFVVDAGGGEAVRFLDTDLGGHERAPSWSPDGSAVAFYHSTGETHELRVAPADGSTSRVVASGAIDTLDAPQWDPTGAKLLYTKAGPGPSSDVYSVGVDGTGETRVTHTSIREHGPRWSSDGYRIAFSTSEGIFVTDAAGTGPALVHGGGWHPEWSPDGTRIAFDDGFDIMTMAPDGSEVRVVVAQAWARSLGPEWSPSGDTLAYLTWWLDGRAACGGIERNDSKPMGFGGNLVSGDDGNETLTGTERGDVFCAFAGDDRVDGGRGGDSVFGDAGADEIRGGPDGDFLRGDGVGEFAEAPRKPVGDDLVFGGGGPDVLWGGRGDDVLVGGRGRDRIRGGPGHDECYAGRADRVKDCEEVVGG
ncbi:MAG: hypothetical protein M3134_09830 [Actinomycetota bacterium]|nr:hypothetical protein [Actinomycetota bacterium]